MKQPNRPQGGRGRRPNSGRGNNQREWPKEIQSYCWTHGFNATGGHNSATCNTKAVGHKDAATESNQLGGSTTPFKERE